MRLPTDPEMRKLIADRFPGMCAAEVASRAAAAREAYVRDLEDAYGRNCVNIEHGARLQHLYDCRRRAVEAALALAFEFPTPPDSPTLKP